MREPYEESREDMAVNEQNYLGPEDEPSVGTFLALETEREIRRVVLAVQVDRYRMLADACERTRWEAECEWERLTAELNALGGEVV